MRSTEAFGVVVAFAVLFFAGAGGDKGGRETNLRGCSFGGCQCSVEDTHTHTERVMTESIGL